MRCAVSYVAADRLAEEYLHLTTIADKACRLTWLVPHSAPLLLRRLLANVYEFGGVHSGAVVCSVIWFSLFSEFLTRNIASNYPALREVVVLALDYALLLLLITLVITVYPRFRFSSHNTFERFHRWGGWGWLALFG
jgi:hypothetical protein